MPFPEYERILFRRNPLDRVFCQVRFPPILRIDAEVPAEFQERVRRTFPNFSERSEWNIDVPSALKGQIPPDIIRQVFQSSGSRNYEFSSDDGNWKINLTRTFVTLNTERYERWELFKEKLQVPLEALAKAYSPDHFSRIGLRYVDVIRRSTLMVENQAWDQLLQPYISGILSLENIAPNVKDFESRYEIGLSDSESTVRIITKFVQAADDAETYYVIDSDFYTTSKTKIESAMDKLDYFNVRSSRLIQWCISDVLRAAMQPEPL